MIKNILFKFAAYSTLALPSSLFAQGAQCDGVKAVGGSCTATALTGPAGAITNIISVLFYIAGALAVVFLLIGAIRYITSTGDATRIKQAKDTIFYSIAGLILAIVAQALIAFVITRLT